MEFAMPMDGEVWKRRMEARQKMTDDERKLKALEDIADAVLNLQVDFTILKAHLTAARPDIRLR